MYVVLHILDVMEPCCWKAINNENEALQYINENFSEGEIADFPIQWEEMVKNYENFSIKDDEETICFIGPF